MGSIVCEVAVEVVDLQRYPACHWVTIIPAAPGTFFAANLDQVPADVTGHFSDRSAIHFPLDPPLHELTVSDGLLALVAAELRAGPTDRLVAIEAGCALAHS